MRLPTIRTQLSRPAKTILALSTSTKQSRLREKESGDDSKRNAIVRGFSLKIDRGQKRGNARGFMQNTANPASSCATVPLSSAQGLLNWPTLLRIHVLLSVRFWSGKRCILSTTTQCPSGVSTSTGKTVRFLLLHSPTSWHLPEQGPASIQLDKQSATNTLLALGCPRSSYAS